MKANGNKKPLNAFVITIFISYDYFMQTRIYKYPLSNKDVPTAVFNTLCGIAWVRNEMFP